MESADSDGALTPLIDDEPVKELDGAKAVAEAAKKTADSAEAFMVLTVYNKMDCARLSFASCVFMALFLRRPMGPYSTWSLWLTHK